MKASLEVVRGEFGPVSVHDKRIPLPEGEFLVGRNLGCHFRPWSKTISRKHCLITITPYAVYVRDLDSRNGTRLNGQPIAGEAPINHGDLLAVGPILLRFVLAETAETAESACGVRQARGRF
ncbi:MAG: FHA domain-containing protein [Planctomycetes bacterium]|nr:FHA domain-containing protein [Planctomycetota bacterium]